MKALTGKYLHWGRNNYTIENEVQAILLLVVQEIFFFDKTFCIKINLKNLEHTSTFITYALLDHA